MKNRKFLLKQDINRTLDNLRKSGSPMFFKTQRYMLYALIEDLNCINRLVSKLAHIDSIVILKLVQLWRHRKNTNKTIQRKISLLKKVIPADQDFPSNNALGIKCVSENKHITFVNAELGDINSTIIRDICSLQYHFGLTKMEAVRFQILLSHRTGLLITRKLAYNSKDRLIPIETNSQKEFLEHIEKEYPNGFIDGFGSEKLLSMLHKSELNRLKIADGNYFRCLYIKNRYLSLKHLSKKELFQKLRFETGFANNGKLKEILICLNVF